MAKVAGSISDEAAFLEALEFGRTIRQADGPADDTADLISRSLLF